jgi:hypothetical protein
VENDSNKKEKYSKSLSKISFINSILAGAIGLSLLGVFDDKATTSIYLTVAGGVASLLLGYFLGKGGKK